VHFGGDDGCDDERVAAVDGVGVDGGGAGCG